MPITIRVKGLEELSASFGKARSLIERHVGDGVQESAKIIRDRARRKAASPPIVFQGELGRSLFTKPSGKLSAVIGSDAKHAPFVEFGTRPHFPPVAPLERWAKVKLGKPGLGFVIAKKIARKGTKAQPYFQPAVDESLQDVHRLIEKAVAQVVRDI